MSSLDWEWLKQNCMNWIKDKCNDVVAIESLVKLKDEAEAKGFAREQVSKAIHKCRKIIDETNTSNQQPPIRTQEEELPPAPEPKKKVPQPNDMQAQKDRGSPNPRIRRDLSSGAEESRGGRPKRKSKFSILDIADGKQTL